MSTVEVLEFVDGMVLTIGPQQDVNMIQDTDQIAALQAEVAALKKTLRQLAKYEHGELGPDWDGRSKLALIRAHFPGEDL